MNRDKEIQRLAWPDSPLALRERLYKIGVPKIILKTADETMTSDDTLTNDAELLLAIGANEVWLFRFLLRLISHTTPDIQFDLALPSGATGRGILYDYKTAPGNWRLIPGTPLSVPTDSTETFLEIVITIVNSTIAGDVALKWAQDTSDANATTIYKNSCLIATRLK